MSIISLIIFLIIIGLVFWVVRTLSGAVIYLLQLLGGGGLPVLRLR